VHVVGNAGGRKWVAQHTTSPPRRYESITSSCNPNKTRTSSLPTRHHHLHGFGRSELSQLGSVPHLCVPWMGSFCAFAPAVLLLPPQHAFTATPSQQML